MLEATGLRVRFGGITALSDVAVVVEPGQIVGLVGPNGAGKSTLFNCITGIVRPDAGSVRLNGTDISRWPPHRRAKTGLGRSFQTPRTDPDMTVLDAVLTGFWPLCKQGTFAVFASAPRVRREEREFRERAWELVRTFRLGAPSTRVGELPLAQLRLLEVARATAGGATYLLLDEPAAGTDDRDRDLLAQVIRDTAARGVGVLLVEHNLGFVLSLSDQVVVLAGGTVIAAGKPDEVSADPDVTNVYLGRPLGQ